MWSEAADVSPRGWHNLRESQERRGEKVTRRAGTAQCAETSRNVPAHEKRVTAHKWTPSTHSRTLCAPRSRTLLLHQLGKKVLPEFFYWKCFECGREYGRDTLCEELGKLDASEIYPRRLSAKEVLLSQKDREFVFFVADGSAKL